MSKKATKKTAEKKTAANTIKAVATKLVNDKTLTAEQIIKGVKAEFPKSAFSMTHVYWYRGRAGITTPLAHDGAAKKPLRKKTAAKKSAKKPAEEKSTAPTNVESEAL